MRTLNIIIFFLTIFSFTTLAQNNCQSTDERKTIEINNSNGDLSITFDNNKITEFVINEVDVDENQYANYQEIIDDFSNEEFDISDITESSPQEEETNQGEELKTLILVYLDEEGHLVSNSKFKIQLNKQFLKVDGNHLAGEVHQDCLDLFEYVYGFKMKNNCEVKYKKSKHKSSTSITIDDQVKSRFFDINIDF